MAQTSDMQFPVFQRRDLLVAVGVSAVALLVYLLTMYPDITGGDSGELITAVASGGVPHPPGYPLYIIFGSLFSHLPFGTLAWRFNFLSGFCDAVSAGLLTAVALRWSGSIWGGILAGTLFAFSPGIWTYAITAEVFALNNLCVTTLLFLAVLYGETHQRRYAFAGALMFGLGMCDHHTFLFAATPLSIWVLWSGRKDLLRPLALLGLVGCFAVGLLPYVLIWTRGAALADVSWGVTNNWSGFWTHISRKEYGTLALSAAHDDSSSSVATVFGFLGDFVKQVGWTGFIVALIGIRAALRRKFFEPAGLAAATALLAILYLGVFGTLASVNLNSPLNRGILSRFWQLPEIFFFLWTGLGAVSLARLVRWRPLLPLLTAAIVVIHPARNYRAMDHHDNRIIHEMASEMLRVAPERAILLTYGDLTTNMVNYVRFAENKRKDVVILDQQLLGSIWGVERWKKQFPDVKFPGDFYRTQAIDGFTFEQFLDANYRLRPLLACPELRLDDPSVGEKSKYALWPLGYCQVVMPAYVPPIIDVWAKKSQDALPKVDFPPGVLPPGSWEREVWGEYYWKPRELRASILMNAATSDPTRPDYLERAAAILADIIKTNPNVQPEVYKNLAVAYGRMGLLNPGDRHRAAEAWKRYLDVAPADDPQLDMVRREIADLSRD
jgi:hypothetical protein